MIFAVPTIAPFLENNMIRATLLTLVLLLSSSCGVSTHQAISPYSQNLSCDAARTQIENFMAQNRTCNSDSDCNTEYGGCIVLTFNNSTSRTELAGLKSIYDNACSNQGLCGIPPGNPSCENHICTSRRY